MIENNIKLVIWDMDETFWKGTISEGEIEIPQVNILTLKTLCERGVVSSISSKNDFEVVRSELEKHDLFKYFIFPHINWMPKGEQVKEIIDECQLRADNVLYIDDNVHNLQEALHHCPNLQIAEPDIIESLLQDEHLKGKDDSKLSRLAHYKTLEEKFNAKKTYSDNTEFLFQSNIRVQINSDCEKEFERIEELINRTNQLNFTKIRLNADELKSLLQDSLKRSFYITVQDKFGDYGVVGFVTLTDENVAEHFLFSCRTIGMGIEQWVYSELKYPVINKQGETISELNKEDRPEWINVSTASKEHKKEKIRRKSKILIRGGCDLSQMEPYLSGLSLDCEFNHLNYHRDHSVYALDILSDDFKQYRDEIVKKVPFVDESNFQTRMFNDKYDYIVISVLLDYSQGIYEFKECPGIKLAHGSFLHEMNRENTLKFAPESMNWFFDNFDFVGRTTLEQFKEYLGVLRKNISKNTKIIFINGCEVPHEYEYEKDIVNVHVEMNGVLDKFVKSTENVYLLDMRKIVTKREELTDNIRHYTRDVYYKMANELVNIINSSEKNTVIHVDKNKYTVMLKKIQQAVLNRFFYKMR